MTHLPDGGYLVSDAVLGSIWRVDREGSVQPGIVPKTFAPADAIPELVFCPTMPEVTVGSVPFLFTDSSIPGVASFAVRGGTVYFNSSCAGAVFRFPLATLFDRREPWQRAADIQRVSPKPAGVKVEELLDMTFDPFDPEDDGIYAADALQFRIIRIDPKGGRRTVVASDPRLLDFPSSLAFVPPLAPGALERRDHGRHDGVAVFGDGGAARATLTPERAMTSEVRSIEQSAPRNRTQRRQPEVVPLETNAQCRRRRWFARLVVPHDFKEPIQDLTRVHDAPRTHKASRLFLCSHQPGSS
jgi:hypothetical protein